MSAGSPTRAQSSIDVSVIVAAWMAADFIERAIASALASADVSIEVIAVDDASPDTTIGVLRRLEGEDSRIVARQLPTNSGPSAARNLGIELARGRYVAVLDADDSMQPDRLAKLVALADRSGADIVVDNMLEIDEAGKRLSNQSFLKSSLFAGARDIDLATWVRFNNPMEGGDTLGYLKPLIRRQKLLDTGISYDTTLRNSEDYYLIAYLLAAGARMSYSADAGYFYTRSTGSISHRLTPPQTRAWLDAERRFLSLHRGRLSKDEQSALRHRGRVLRKVNQLVAILDAIKARKIVTSAGLVASDLRNATYAIGVLAKIAMGKALRRKRV